MVRSAEVFLRRTQPLVYQFLCRRINTIDMKSVQTDRALLKQHRSRIVLRILMCATRGLFVNSLGGSQINKQVSWSRARSLHLL